MNDPPRLEPAPPVHPNYARDLAEIRAGTNLGLQLLLEDPETETPEIGEEYFECSPTSHGLCGIDTAYGFLLIRVHTAAAVCAARRGAPVAVEILERYVEGPTLYLRSRLVRAAD